MSYKDIEVNEFAEGFQNDSNSVLLDVRTDAEVNDGHIEGMIQIDIYSPDFAAKVAELDKTKNYYVYCRSGNRSGSACGFMTENGFTGELYNLAGGVMAWAQSKELNR